MGPENIECLQWRTLIIVFSESKEYRYGITNDEYQSHITPRLITKSIYFYQHRWSASTVARALA
jgi:hypothetical protein